MDIRLRPLENLQDAKALARCVYEVYGLTFHRSYLYEPERTLSLNQQGHLTSILAMDGDTCVGHVALIRPYYEYTEAGTPVAGDAVREIGLMMVQPRYREQQVQHKLTAAAMGWARQREDLEGLTSRCVTHHTASQRAARRVGAVPTAMFLGGVPFWVQYESHRGPDARQPISTLSYFATWRGLSRHTSYLPEIDRDLYEKIYARMEQPRDLRDPREGPELGPPSEVRVHFDPHKQQGRIHVLSAGPDIEEVVLQRYRWLMAGRIRHVTLMAPLSSPFTARAVAAWKGEGMLFGGILPALHTHGDVLMLQGLRLMQVDERYIEVIDPVGAAIKERCIEDWTFARDLPEPKVDFGGYASPSLTL